MTDSAFFKVLKNIFFGIGLKLELLKNLVDHRRRSVRFPQVAVIVSLAQHVVEGPETRDDLVLRRIAHS